MDFVGELLLGFIVRFLRDEGVAVRGCGTMFCRVVVPQRVTLPSLKFEQAVIYPDGPSPATGEGKGVRSRAPPVADAARRSTRSGRKNRASEQREDFFGHRKAVGADAPAATFGAHLCAVRIWIFRLRKI